MIDCRRSVAVGVLGVTAMLGSQIDAQTPLRISLRQHTYQAVRAAPFNEQLAFYAGDVPSNGASVKLPVTIVGLIGNGRRPFAADAGYMEPREFDAYVTRLKNTGAVRTIPFRINQRGDQLGFRYLSRSFAVSATELISCRDCPGRVVLTLN